jgi:hypothetical protein
MPPLNFVITVQIAGLPDVITHGEITDSEHKTLLLYLEQYDELVRSKPCREGFPCNISLKFNAGTPLDVKTSFPDSDVLSILLHRLRPFILQNEPANFESVCSLVGKAVANQHVRQMLHNQRELYDGRKSRQMMQISLNKVLVNSERGLYDWLNSHEYHRDQAKRNSVDGLFQGMPGDLMRALLVSMLVDKVTAISNIASFVHVLLTKGQSLQFGVNNAEAASLQVRDERRKLSGC